MLQMHAHASRRRNSSVPQYRAEWRSAEYIVQRVITVAQHATHGGEPESNFRKASKPETRLSYSRSLMIVESAIPGGAPHSPNPKASIF